MQHTGITRRYRYGLAVLLLLSAVRVHAEGLTHTPNDFGDIGLWQTPTARFAEDGELIVGASTEYPYNRYFITVQALPWLEGTLRYTAIVNRLFGPVSFSGNQTYKDRGLDMKVRVMKESKYLPQLAIGLRDIGGTSLFGSEYIVGSKRFRNWDVSAGLGWGYLGGRGDIRNPLSFFSSSFDSRQTIGRATPAGRFQFTQLFHGARVGIFGGVEYHTPIAGLTLKLELDGNDYKVEPLANTQNVSLPINVGLTYKPMKWLTLSTGLERGNTFMAQMAISTNLNKKATLPKFDRQPVAIQRSEADSDATEQRIIASLTREEFLVDAVETGEQEITAWLTQSRYRAIPKGVGRAARVLANEAPDSVALLTVAQIEDGIETNRTTLYRHELEGTTNGRISADEIWHHATLDSKTGYRHADATINANRYPSWSWSIAPKLRQQVGGPDNFYLWQIWAKIGGEIKLLPGLSLTGAIGLDLINNLDQLRLNSNSVLPHVRSDIKFYLQEGENNLVQLEMDYLWKPADDLYARLSTGLFEEMYGGVGGELLYRPYGARWAVGTELNWVKQRDFDQRFSFRDYDVVTGHGTLYYETPFDNILAKLSVGRYLAKDKGFTIDLSRRFDNGSRVGAFATFTNVSAEDFGEGSFDKGLYISIPFDSLLVHSTRSFASVAWRPLTRDGGQRVNVGKRLYGYTQSASPGAMSRDWGQLLD